MSELILQSLFQYYGLDWVAMMSGLIGTTFLARKMRSGFLLCIVASICGVIVAYISLQFGYILYNAVLVGIMAKGYADWGTEPEKIRVRK